jgi:hypothetical protein
MTNMTNGRWQTAGILVAFALALLGWVYSLGVNRQTVIINTRDINRIERELDTMRGNNVALSIEIARLSEAVNQLNTRLDREALE